MAVIAVVDDELYIVQEYRWIATWIVAGQIDTDMVFALLGQGTQPQQVDGNPVVAVHAIARHGAYRIGPVVPFVILARDIFALEPEDDGGVGNQGGEAGAEVGRAALPRTPSSAPGVPPVVVASRWFFCSFGKLP